jgi:hypothetical protein
LYSFVFRSEGQRRSCVEYDQRIHPIKNIEDEITNERGNMKASVTHDREEETIEAKTRWFRSLPMEERMELFCSFVDLALSVNPGLEGRKLAKPVTGRIQVISPA